MLSLIQKKNVLFVTLVLVLLFAGPAVSGDMIGNDKDGGADIPDLVVRNVTVTPIRAHVGDVVRIDMEWDYWGDITKNYYDTNFAMVRANGKVVASKKYTSYFGVRPGEVKRETFLWDTGGMAPGMYRIRGEVPLNLDKTPYDNYLDVKEPLLLVPRGASFPAGEEPGGSAVAKDPY